MSSTKKTKTAKTGRPKDAIEKVTISFRIPKQAEDAVANLATTQTAKTPGRTIKASDIYNEALASFLLKHGVKIPGWNAAA